MLEYDELTDFLYDAPSSARFTMPETPLQSVIQRIIDCQIGSSIRFFGSDPAAPGDCFRECNRITTCSFNNHKAEVVKK